MIRFTKVSANAVFSEDAKPVPSPQFPPVPPAPEPVPFVTELRAAIEHIAKRGRGRPRKPDSAKPWIAAGVSRASWYRKNARSPAAG